MPPYRKFQVESLKNLCKVTLTNMAINNKLYIIKNMHKLKVKQHNDTLNNTEKYILFWDLPDEIYTELTIKLFERIYELIRVREINDIVKLMQFFLNNKLQRLQCNNMPKEMAIEIEKRIGFISELTHLELSVQPTYTLNLSASSFSSMKNLISFTLKFHGTDEIIEIISYNCFGLRELDVYGSEKVTDRSCSYLEKLKRLKKLNLSGTNVTTSCLGQFIIKNQTLTHLKVIDGNEVLNYLMTKRPELSKPSYLKIFNDLYAVGSEQLKFASWFFPNLEKINCVLTIHDIDTLYLDFFKNLSHLELCENIIYNEFSKNNLKLRRSNVISLRIVNITSKNEDLFYDSMEYCPNLKLLNLVPVDCNIYSGRKIAEKYFQRLETLHFIMFNKSNLLESILINSINIKWLYIKYSYLDHDTLCRILSMNPLANVEKFILDENQSLGMESVRMLLDSCPNLKVIGPLMRWKLISEEHIKELKANIEVNNWDLDIDQDRI